MSSIERRRHVRIPLSYVSIDTYSLTDDDIIKTESGMIEDISESGIRFRTSNPYSINQLIRLTFVLPSTTTPIRTDAVIVFQQQNGSKWIMGAQYSGLALIEYTLIKNYIQRYLKVN